MMELDEQTAQYHVRYEHLHGAIVRQMPHLHVLGRLSMSVCQSHGEGLLQHILGLREGEIALSSGLVSFSDLAARFAYFGRPELFFLLTLAGAPQGSSHTRTDRAKVCR